MSSEWLSHQLQDLLEITSSKRIHMADYVLSGVPFYRGKEVIERSKGSTISTDLFITHDKFIGIKEKFGSPVNGDILLTSVGTLGVPYFVNGDGDFYFKDGNVTWFRNAHPDIFTKFVYYWLLSSETQTKLNQIAIGSTQRALTIASLKTLNIVTPPKDIQSEIVGVLDSLSDRITLLRETNQTLEAIAQAIFKSWFVDFDPVRAKMEGRQPVGMDEDTAALFPDELVQSDLGLIPKGWEVKTIGEVVETVGGATPDTNNQDYWEPAEHCWTSPKDLSSLIEPVLLRTGRRISSSGLSKIGSGLLPAGTLLMSSRAPIGYLAITDLPVAINQGYIAIPPGGRLSPLYMLLWCSANMEGIKGRANGSTFMEISKKAFRPFPILLPNEQALGSFEKTAHALFARLVTNSKKAVTLSNLRDTLLPRLISGKLRVPIDETEAVTNEE